LPLQLVDAYECGSIPLIGADPVRTTPGRNHLLRRDERCSLSV